MVRTGSEIFRDFIIERIEIQCTEHDYGLIEFIHMATEYTEQKQNTNKKCTEFVKNDRNKKKKQSLHRIPIG